MTRPDPSERWRELDRPDAPVVVPETSGRSSGPSPYEAYPWAAVGGPPPVVAYPVVSGRHPGAGTSLALGLVGLLGGALCVVPLLASPVAVVVGGRALREIEASAGAVTGRGAAATGVALGALGSAVLALAVVAIIVFVA